MNNTYAICPGDAKCSLYRPGSIYHKVYRQRSMIHREVRLYVSSGPVAGGDEGTTRGEIFAVQDVQHVSALAKLLLMSSCYFIMNPFTTTHAILSDGDELVCLPSQDRRYTDKRHLTWTRTRSSSSGSLLGEFEICGGPF